MRGSIEVGSCCIPFPYHVAPYTVCIYVAIVRVKFKALRTYYFRLLKLKSWVLYLSTYLLI